MKCRDGRPGVVYWQAVYIDSFFLICMRFGLKFYNLYIYMLPILAGICLQFPINLLTYGPTLDMMTYIHTVLPTAMYIGRGNQIAYGTYVNLSDLHRL